MHLEHPSPKNRLRTVATAIGVALLAVICSAPLLIAGESTDPPSTTAAQEARESYDQIKSQALEKWGEIKSLRASLNRVQEYGDGEKRALERIEGQYDYDNTGGRPRVRWESVSMTAVRMDEADNMTEEQKLIVYDGEFTYILLKSGKKTRAQKFKLDEVDVAPVGGPAFFQVIERDFTPRGLDPAKLDARPVHVIEATPKRGGDKVLFFIDREDGVLRKKYAENEAAGTYNVTSVTKLDTNVEFDKDHFVFVPPDGVAVYDGTQRNAKEKEPQSTEEPDSTNPDQGG